MTTPTARDFPYANLRGAGALYGRELRRGLRLWSVSLAAPALRAAILAGIFSVVLAGSEGAIASRAFLDFLLPGLVAAAVLERSFEAIAFSIVYDKLEGSIDDVVRAPLTPAEVTLAYGLSAMTSAMLAGLGVWLVLLPFGLGLPQFPLLTLVFAALGSLSIAFFAQIAGLWARKWDHISAAQTFVLIPFVFLSGVFFSIERLPALGQTLIQANPIFYAVNGLRYAITGVGDADPVHGAALLFVLTTVFMGCAYRLFAIGYRIKN